jgi:hypothetical protein
MATRTIVTSHPDVACDLCGRRLLRGEQPDVYMGGGQRRMVCELCTRRAAQEGWRRETEAPTTAPRSPDPQRGRSLLDRLRQSRWPMSERRARPVRASAPGALAGGEAPGEDEWAARPSATIGRDWAGADPQWAGAGSGPAGAEETWSAAPNEETGIGATPAAGNQPGGGSALADEVRQDEPPGEPPSEAPADPATGVRRALEVFNSGEQPRRIAGVARALGAPCVKAAPVQAPGETVAIVVAWELCWYRYEIDLQDSTAGTRLAAEGMELAELPPDDRTANATADERGELSLLDAWGG